MLIHSILKKNYPFFVSIGIYLICFVFINPSGEFAVNDDWIFKRQVEVFSHGNFKISALIDPSFVIQGLLGFIWSIPFGYSFASLRSLTVLTLFIGILGLYKILKLFNLKEQFIVLILLTFIFNPLVFSSSMSFMTEIYFLTFYIWGIYFCVKFFYCVRPSHFGLYVDAFMESIFFGLAFLVRQVSIVGFLTFMIVFLITKLRSSGRRSLSYVKLSFTQIPFVVSILAVIFWPRFYYGNSGFLRLINLHFFYAKIPLLLYSLFYLAFFVSSIILFKLSFISKRLLFFLSSLAFVLGAWIFTLDIFPIGNVLYLEELYSKSNFKSSLSIFDNLIFKLFLSFFIAFATISFFDWLKKSYLKLNATQIFLLLNFLGLFFLAFLSNDFYDRYLLPAFLSLLILLISLSYETYSSEQKHNLFHQAPSYFAVSLLFLVSFILQYEFIKQTQLRWSQAEKISKLTGYYTDISVDGVYTKYFNAKKESDYSGLIRTMPFTNYKCFVQKYTVETDSVVLKTLNAVDGFLNRFMEKPRVEGGKKVPTSMPKAKNNLDHLIFNQEYFSFLYSPIGKKAFVGSWCI